MMNKILFTNPFYTSMNYKLKCLNDALSCKFCANGKCGLEILCMLNLFSNYFQMHLIFLFKFKFMEY